MATVDIDNAALRKLVSEKAYVNMFKSVEFIRGAVIAKLSQPGTGRQYGKHRASSPGEPPAPDTGTLRNSVYTNVDQSGVDTVGTVVANVSYAHPLEVGTSKIAARPFMRPAFDESLKTVKAIFEK